MTARYYLQGSTVCDAHSPVGDGSVAACNDHLMAVKICNFLNWQINEKKESKNARRKS